MTVTDSTGFNINSNRKVIDYKLKVSIYVLVT